MTTTLEQPIADIIKQAPPLLRDCVSSALKHYFAELDDISAVNIYEMVISEVEKPLLEAILVYTKGNQSRAAQILGLSRGTLRKKLKIYNLLESA